MILAETVAWTWKRHPALRYGFAVIVVAAAAGLRLLLESAYDVTPPYITFYPATMLVAVMGGGSGPGVFATLLSASYRAVSLIEQRGRIGCLSHRQRTNKIRRLGYAGVSAIHGDVRRSGIGAGEFKDVQQPRTAPLGVADCAPAPLHARHSGLKKCAPVAGALKNGGNSELRKLSKVGKRQLRRTRNPALR